MRITLTVEVADLITYSKVVNAINNSSNASVVSAELAGATSAPRTAVRRRVATTRNGIERLISDALALDPKPRVKIDYIGSRDLFYRTRTVVPVQWYDDEGFRAVDEADGGIRHFKLSGINQAEVL